MKPGRKQARSRKPAAKPAAAAIAEPAASAQATGRWPGEWGVYAPVLVALAVLLPRMIHAQFGLLDDAVTLGNARGVWAHPLASLHAYESAGRFLPFYWLYWALCYAIGGTHPAVFYAANAALAALTVTGLIALMRKFQATVFMTWAAALWFIFSAAATEAYGTLSKGEPLALAAMLGSVWMAQRAGRAYESLPYWTLAGALALVAVGTRETAIALAGIAGAWCLLAFLGKPVLLPRRGLAIYLGVLAAALGPFFLARFVLRKSLAAGGYAAHYQFTADNLSQSGRFWGYNLARNFPELALLLVAGAVLAGLRKLRQGQLLGMMMAWMMMAAGILLPWPHGEAYYDLAFTAGSSVFCGVMAGELLRVARGCRRGWGGWMGRWAARAALGVIGALGVILAIDNTTFAESQINVDEANAGLLEALARLPPHSVVLVNLPGTHEYFYEIRQYAQTLFGRPDLRIVPLDFRAPDAGEAEFPHYVVSLDIARERWPLVRGPMTENVTALWKRYWEQARGVTGAAPREIGRTWQMADLGLEFLWCGMRAGPAVVCPEPPFRPVLDLRRSFYAWEIYPYLRWKSPVRVASFEEGVWTIEQPSGEPLRLALGAPGDVPVAADWEGDGQLEPGVYRPSANRWFIDRDLTGKADLVFALPGMQAGDIPVAGAWEGRGAGPGYYRPEGHAWHLFRSAGSTREDLPVVHMGGPGAIPVAGDWDGDGRATPGFYQPAGGEVTLINELADLATPVRYAVSPGMPAVVNWTGAGVDTVNTTQRGKWARRFANCICEPSNPPVEFASGLGTGQLFAGRWKSPRGKR